MSRIKTARQAERIRGGIYLARAHLRLIRLRGFPHPTIFDKDRDRLVEKAFRRYFHSNISRTMLAWVTGIQEDSRSEALRLAIPMWYRDNQGDQP